MRPVVLVGLLLVWVAPVAAMDESIGILPQQAQGAFGQLEDVSVLLSPPFTAGAPGPQAPSRVAPVFGTGVPAHFLDPATVDLDWPWPDETPKEALP